MPALLTTTKGMPKLSFICSMTAASESGSVTLRTIPWPSIWFSRSVLEINSAPLSLVAVPNTVPPSRPSSRVMALPIPRVAPVTKQI